MKISTKFPLGTQTIISFGRIFAGIALKLKKVSIHVHPCHPMLQQTAGDSQIDKHVLNNKIESGARLSLQFGGEYCRHIETPKAGD